MSTGVSLHALAGLTSWHADEDGVITACGTVIVTIVIAIFANVGADDAFAFTEDSCGIAGEAVQEVCSRAGDARFVAWFAHPTVRG